MAEAVVMEARRALGLLAREALRSDLSRLVDDRAPRAEIDLGARLLVSEVEPGSARRVGRHEAEPALGLGVEQGSEAVVAEHPTLAFAARVPRLHDRLGVPAEEGAVPVVAGHRDPAAEGVVMKAEDVAVAAVRLDQAI